jgi:hypothetical protein
MILHLSGCFPKNAIVLDFYGDIAIPKLFAVFWNVDTPVCKYSLNQPPH